MFVLAKFVEIQSLFLATIISLPRITMVLWMLPFLTESIFPKTIRLVFGFSLVLIALPRVAHEIPAEGLNFFFVLGIVVKEVFIGLLLGFMVSIPIWAASAMGFIIDLQRGSFIATLFTPFFRGQTSPVGIMLIQTIAVLFFSGGGFLILLNGLYGSYLMWPILEFFPKFDERLPTFFLDQLQFIVFLALTLSAPIVILMLLVDWAMGLINRFVPQLNVFFLSLPIKGALAIFILIIYANTLFGYFLDHYSMIYSIFDKLNVVLQ